MATELTRKRLATFTHCTHLQLDTVLQLLGGTPESLVEMLDMILSIHMLSYELDQEEIEETLNAFRDNVLGYVEQLREHIKEHETDHHSKGA